MPTVAAVDGAAIGAGIRLLLCCDLAVCTPASRFDLRFLDVGIHPGGGALWWLERVIGRQGVAALALFGECSTARKPRAGGWSGVAWQPTISPRRPAVWRRKQRREILSW